MKGWPYGSHRVPTEDVTAGDLVVVAGLGAFAVRHVLDVPALGRIAVLGWDSLAVILRPGTTTERLHPAPDATPIGRSRTLPASSPDTGEDPNVRPALPLAG